MELSSVLGLQKKPKTPRPPMFLAKGKPCPRDTLFDVPHKPEPMTAKELQKTFPAFAKEMDGTYHENTLSYFYKYNKERKVYEIQDPEMEDELAELLGVTIFEGEKDDGERPEARPLTEEEHQVFREHIQDIREKLKQSET